MMCLHVDRVRRQLEEVAAVLRPNRHLRTRLLEAGRVSACGGASGSHQGAQQSGRDDSHMRSLFNGTLLE